MSALHACAHDGVRAPYPTRPSGDEMSARAGERRSALPPPLYMYRCNARGPRPTAARGPGPSEKRPAPAAAVRLRPPLPRAGRVRPACHYTFLPRVGPLQSRIRGVVTWCRGCIL